MDYSPYREMWKELGMNLELHDEIESGLVVFEKIFETTPESLEIAAGQGNKSA